MPTYTQANRPLAITTPLGKDVLLLTAFRGFEAVSELFSFQLDLLAEAVTPIHFDGIAGQHVTVELQLASEEKRYLNGMVKSFRQGSRDDVFTHFRAEMVPQFWLLTKRVRSRIFQRLPVPDILHQALAGLDVKYEMSGTYFPRDYCVQYRESDSDFASRLMEEEGIYYFFQHSDGAHKMVVSDAPNRHPPVPGQSRVIYDEVPGGVQEGMRIRSWEKTQELRSGVYTLWDHRFELPGRNLEVKERTIDSVTVGKATHKLHMGGNDHLEIYEYPGGYAQRFDGIDGSGGLRPQDLKDIFKDSSRTARIRMEQEQIQGLRVEGTSDCCQFAAGHKFTLERHFDADGDYLLTRVEHTASLGKGSYRSDTAPSEFHYENRFTGIPVALPYRPQRVTRKPVIAGAQTAAVVGQPGQEIFCDKYGRVKVQFHWDRGGKRNAESSCWLRVAQVWAGKGWGAFFWPRVGHEVVVTFEEGEPDQPLIVGSVYNAENMPPLAFQARHPLQTLRHCCESGTRAILNHRATHDSPTGHYTVVVDVDARDVVLHDPFYGPSRRLPHAELFELWQPRFPNSEIAGDMLIAIADKPPAVTACWLCRAPLPPAVTCPRCKEPVGLQPSGALGRIESSCVARMWNYLCCPFCDCGFTSSTQATPGDPIQPGPPGPESPGAQPATAPQENPLDLSRLFAEVDKFCSFILAVPGAAAHLEIRKQLDIITSSKEDLKLAAESLVHRKAHQEQLAKLAQTAKQSEEAHRKKMEELNRPSPPLDANALGRALLKNLGWDS